ncbi:MAG: hypothetical protein GXY67_06705 [Clostridiales bacterium]|nr:hypothetical protein [Clostridiales bacterium]
MAKFINTVKLGWLKGVEGIGTFASNLASNAKFKVAEINLETRRREVIAEFTQKAYDMWQNGTQLPEPLNSMLQEACELDERLSLLRAQRYAAVDSEGKKEVQSTGNGPEGVKEEGEATQPAEKLQEEPMKPVEYTEASSFADEKKDPDVADEGHQEQTNPES